MSYKVVEIDSDNVEEYSKFIDQDLQEQLDREFFRGIGAVDDTDTPVGAMVYELLNAELSADTRSRIRLLGGNNDEIKNALMNEYASVIEDDEVVESVYETPDQIMSQILKDNGFSLDSSESEDIIVGIEDIKKIAALLKGRNAPSYIKCLSEVAIPGYRKFVKECLFKGYRGIVEDLAYVPKSWFDQELSSCVETDDNINGALLIKKNPSGLLYAMLFTAFGADFQKNLALMMAHSASKAVELYPDGVKLVIRRHSPTVQRLTDKFFASTKGDNVFKGNRNEN